MPEAEEFPQNALFCKEADSEICQYQFDNTDDLGEKGLFAFTKSRFSYKMDTGLSAFVYAYRKGWAYGRILHQIKLS